MFELIIAIIILVGAPTAMLMVCDGLVCFVHAHQRLHTLTCVPTCTVSDDTVVDDTVVTRSMVTLSDAGFHLEHLEKLVVEFRKLNHQYSQHGLPYRGWTQMNKLRQEIKDKAAMIKATVRV